MHRSRIALFCLDVPAAQREESEHFWSGATGRGVRRGVNHPEYSVFESGAGQDLLLQAVGDNAPRIHLDIHTDDLDAETKRLLALGARELDRHGDWVVMLDPAGIIFCVVPVEPGDRSLDGANEWP